MRQMTKDLEEKPIEKTEVSNLDQVSMTRKERRKYRKEQIEETTKDMTPSEKRKYLLYYYKEKIIIAVAAIVILTIVGVSYYKTSRPITISYVVVNCQNQMEFNVDAIEQYAKDIGKFDGYQIKGDTNVQLLKDEYNSEYEANPNSQKYISFETMATADYYDVVITNMEGAVYCGETNVFYPLDKYLDEESYNKVKDKIVILNNMDGQPGQYAIDVSDNEFMKSLNVGYDDIYIGFAGDQKDNHERNKELINYLFP